MKRGFNLISTGGSWNRYNARSTRNIIAGGCTVKIGKLARDTFTEHARRWIKVKKPSEKHGSMAD